MIKAILFDMDGVLIDAKDWHYEALNKALDLFGMPIERDSHLATYDGLPTRRKLEMLTKARRLPIGLHPFLNELKQEFTAQLTYSNCKPDFRHQQALSQLKKDGLKLAVCSNSILATINLMMKLSKLDAYLDVVLSNEDVLKPKPDPEIYVAAIRQFGLKAEECLVLEDNEHGIAAARASGAHVMVVGDTTDVYYEAIARRIDAINKRA